jgi:Fe-S-cluster containining protein
LQRPTHSPLEQARHLQSIARRLNGIKDVQAEVTEILAEMDRGYTQVAAHYGFTCQGCEESCCRTVFYHHTYAEFLLLIHGLNTLSEPDREDLYGRAVATQVAIDAAPADEFDGPPRSMCPINVAGRCALYAYRPMICRLHGVPHELRRPDGRVINGPGCHLFDTLSRGEVSRRLDRTPFYRRLAQLEQGLRRHIEAPIRLHMTLAECLVAFADDGDGVGSTA